MTRPNFLVIVADDLGYADLGCYGGREPVSPVLDSLAAQAKLVTLASQIPDGSAVTVAGHTDSIGTDAVNQPLSEKRAEAVKDYLVSKGIESRNFIVTCDLMLAAIH